GRFRGNSGHRAIGRNWSKMTHRDRAASRPPSGTAGLVDTIPLEGANLTMLRRHVIALLAGAALSRVTPGLAQQASGMARVGFVYPGPRAVAATRVEAIISGLRVSGFAAPAQVEMVVRTADGDPSRLGPMVEEVLAKDVNVFVANGPPILRVAHTIG